MEELEAMIINYHSESRKNPNAFAGAFKSEIAGSPDGLPILRNAMRKGVQECEKRNQGHEKTRSSHWHTSRFRSA